jgi:anion-transporting  ArsA/GET3 family ATPase
VNAESVGRASGLGGERFGRASPFPASLEGKKVIIVAGSGGVGKTTTAAALALGLAAQGLRVAVVTIDPARRLATALGLEELGNEPRRVEGIELDGELHAMQLDAKRTFDELIERLAPDDRTRREVLQNRIYRELSGAMTGSQEFTAVAKLYELHRDERYDVLVLDTPPSRNALDFLDAPDRLIGFLDGRGVQAVLAPTGLAARVVGHGTGVAFSVLRRITGIDLLEDLAVFFRSLSGLLDGFRRRAAGVKALLGDPATTFLLVTSPEREPVEEALFFHGRLQAAGMPFGGLVVNRVHRAPAADAAAAQAELAGALGERLAAKVADALRDVEVLARRDAEAIERLRRELDVEDPVVVPLLEHDVYDLRGLALLQLHLLR